MLAYRIVSHVPGRIRLFVPLIRKLSIDDLKKVSKITVHEGIRNVGANPLTGSILIEYDHGKLDIIDYIRSLSEDPALSAIIEKASNK